MSALTPTERLAKIAAIVEHADAKGYNFLDSAEMLGVYLLATATPEKFQLREGSGPAPRRPA